MPYACLRNTATQTVSDGVVPALVPLRSPLVHRILAGVGCLSFWSPSPLALALSARPMHAWCTRVRSPNRVFCFWQPTAKLPPVGQNAATSTQQVKTDSCSTRRDCVTTDSTFHIRAKIIVAAARLSYAIGKKPRHQRAAPPQRAGECTGLGRCGGCTREADSAMFY